MALALLLPLGVSLLVAVLGRWATAELRDAAMVLGAAGLLPLVWQVAAVVLAGGRPGFAVAEIVPGFSLAFSVEPLGALFALVAAFLWPVTALYGVGYMRGHHESNQTRFFVCFSAAISAALGVAFAANLITLFVFYEVLTLSTWPLVTHHQNSRAQAAGRVYLGILLFTSVGLLLPAILWTSVAAGTTDFVLGGILPDDLGVWPAALLLGMFAFGIGKAALMPFHRWLPNAMVAPTPVSALLHAVAVVKAGVFSVLKVALYTFGLDLLNTGASTWLMYAAATTLLLGSLIALTKDNLKERLAYSTISQLAYIVLGAAIATPAAILGAALHIVMHAFGKITLFFCAGAIDVAAHRKSVSQLDGLGRRMPLTFVAFGVGALSVVGLPPTGGAWSKWLLGVGAADAGHPVLVGVLMLSSLLNVGYLLSIVARAFYLPPADDTADAQIGEASALTLVPPLISAVGCVVLFFTAPAIYDAMLPLVGGSP